MKLIEYVMHLYVTLLEKGSNKPLSGADYQVKFYDRDYFGDDPLGSARVDKDGIALVPIVQSLYRSVDTPLEQYPDLYFVVEKNGKEVYESPTYPNVHLKETGKYDENGALFCDLGTFILDLKNK